MGNIEGYQPKKRSNVYREEMNHQLENHDDTSNGSIDRYDSVSQRNRMLRKKIR